MAEQNIKKIFLSVNNRSVKYEKNSILLLLSQFFGVVVSLLLVPITLNYLGVQEYGIWITLTTIITWFSLFDIGLSHGLRNKYAEARARQEYDEVKKYVSTTFFLLLFISGIFILVYSVFSPFINWAVILHSPTHIERELNILAFFVIGMFCVRFFLSIINTLLVADQEPGIPAVIGFAGNVLSLCSVFVVTITLPSSILYVGVVLTLSQILPLIFTFIYFFATRYKFIIPSLSYFSKSHINNILSLGSRFFFIQITALILFQSNNIIIAHVCGTEDVTEFNIAYKYINVLFIAFSAFVSPLWSASTDAYIKNDISWIRVTMKRLNHIWILLIVSGMGLIILAPFLYKLWLQNKILPKYDLLIMILLYFIFLSRSYLYRNFINGVGKISLQFYATLVQSILHVPLAVLLGKLWGIYGIVTTMIIWALINSIWEPIQFERIVSKSAKGIWNK